MTRYYQTLDSMFCLKSVVGKLSIYCRSEANERSMCNHHSHTGELAPHPDQATAVLVVALKPRVHRCDAVTLPFLLFSPAYNVGGR